VIVHLVDGTYELFRHFYGLRRFTKGADRPLGAVVGVLQSVLEIVERGETHVGVATDHVVESFRNDLWPGYKTSAGIEPALFAQFHPLEDALAAMGVVVWPMVELEADDALASAAHLADGDPAVEKVCIWTPDKDLAQCVRDDRVVQVDRRGKAIRDAVGAARLLNRHGAIEAFPPAVLGNRLPLALLFKQLATLRTDAPLFKRAEALRWRGPTAAFSAWTEQANAPRLLERCRKASAASA